MFKSKLTLENQTIKMGQDVKRCYAADKKVQHILEKCYLQNEHFQKWAKQQKWATFHHSHYDWWAFPINQNSMYGDQYKVTNRQIQILIKDQKFLSTLKRNAQLVCLSWGYCLPKRQFIANQLRKQHQKWQNWPIRLYKMTKSLQIFKCQQYFKSAVIYGNLLINKGLPMQYGKRNIKEYFLECQDKIKKQKQ